VFFILQAAKREQLRGYFLIRQSVNINIKGVGSVLFERSKRAKNLNIYLKPDKTIRVAIPYGVSLKKAEKTVYFKIDWIQKYLTKIKSLEQKHNSILSNSSDINITEAREKIINRLNKLAENYGFKYNKVFIRKQKTLWGSCSSGNNISLNINLTRLPNNLIDYIILHELVHTKVKNHGKDFWIELGRFIENAKMLSLKLKKYQFVI
jgi:predicted metal-dependent hydrolase